MGSPDAQLVCTRMELQRNIPTRDFVMEARRQSAQTRQQIELDRHQRQMEASIALEVALGPPPPHFLRIKHSRPQSPDPAASHSTVRNVFVPSEVVHGNNFYGTVAG